MFPSLHYPAPHFPALDFPRIASGGGGGGDGVYFPSPYWPSLHFPSLYFPDLAAPVALPPDLLSALVAYLRGEPTITAVVGENVFTEIAPAGTNRPFLVLRAYDEQLPGMSEEDQQIEVDVIVATPDLDSAMTISAVIKAALDPPNFNPDSIGRAEFVYEGGAEYTMLRKHSRPMKQPGIARSGTYSYNELIQCCFYVTPEL